MMAGTLLDRGRIVMAKVKPLSTKFIRSKKAPGRYPDGDGLYLVVGVAHKPNYHGSEQARRWEFEYSGKRFGKGRKRTMGFGSLRDVTLAAARKKRHEARVLIDKGIDPIEHHKQQEQERRKTATKTKTFKVVADEFVKAQITKVRPWKDSTRIDAESMIKGHLKPLHDIPVREITPKNIYDIVEPLRHHAPTMAKKALDRTRSVIDWGYVIDAMPADRMNPASMKGNLRKMFGADNLDTPHEPLDAIPYEKVPALWALLDAVKPRTHYTVGEAARAVGLTHITIYNAIATGRLRSTKPEYPVFAGSWQEHQIAPADLFQVWRKVVDVIPGLPPVNIYFLKFLILNGSRCDEVRLMPWSEYQRKEELWVIPWERMKGRNRSGRKQIPIDHVIPLSRTSIEILRLLEEQRARDKSDSPYVFANYRTANSTSSRIGQPLCRATVENLLARLLRRLNDDQPLSRGDIAGTLHGMRTSFRSWLGDQRINGHRRFDEADMERAIAHVGGYGETEVSRLYSRLSKTVVPLIEMFDAWGNYVIGGQSAKVVHLPFHHKQVAKGRKRG
jgi:integrase